MNKIFFLMSLMVVAPLVKAAEDAPAKKTTVQLAQESRAYAAYLNRVSVTTSVAYLGVCFVGALAKKVPFIGSMRPLRTAINVVEWPLGFGSFGYTIAHHTVANNAEKLEIQAELEKKTNQV